jgi:GT2 family glycosyltransferase
MTADTEIRAIGSERMRLAAVITCHNRKSHTLLCLESLKRAAQLAISRVHVTVYLVDDGSTDGTTQDVRARFPDVRIIPGSGVLYWCGGMRLAWCTAASDAIYDGYLWLNDDVELFADSLNVLLDTQSIVAAQTGRPGIIVGATRDEQTGVTSYGDMGSAGVSPAGESPRPVELFNGNIVLVPDSVYRMIGGLSRFYSHGFGDMDYAVRARRYAVPTWLAAGHLGSCAANSVPRWSKKELPLWSRFIALHRPTGCPPWELALLMIRSGKWWFPYSIARLYWRVLFPTDADENDTPA